MIEKIIYFGVGILNDILVTLYYMFVGRRQAIPASLLTILMTFLSFLVIEKIVINLNWISILFYALGSAIGCFFIIKTEKYIKKRKN